MTKELLIAVGVFLGCSASFAQPAQAPSLPTDASARLDQDRAACEGDVKRLCTSARPAPGDQTVLNCLLSHKSELTDACRNNVAALFARRTL